MKTSPIESAVLALVIEQPSHAYELWKRYERRFGDFMPVLTSRIYKTVKQLSDAALIEPMRTADEEGSRLRGPQYRAATASELRRSRGAS
jgi:DNA-binding PadR family transcriptional regulator